MQDFLQTPQTSCGRSLRGVAAIAPWLLLGAGACTYDFDRFAGGGGKLIVTADGSAGDPGKAEAGLGQDSRVGLGGDAMGNGNSGGGGSPEDEVGGDASTEAGRGGSGGTASVPNAGGYTNEAGGTAVHAGGAATDAGLTVTDGDTSDVPGTGTDAAEGEAEGGMSFDCAAVAGQVFGGRCYYAMSTLTTWEQASAACAPAHLVTLTSSEEQTAIEGLLSGQDHWMGMLKTATSRDTESSLHWVTTETYSPASSYRHWASSEPNFSGDCVRIRADGYWADAPCTQLMRAICERE